MSLNVKSTEAHELAAELARLTGRSMTDVVVDALRKQLAEVRRHEQKEILVQELMEIGKRCAAHIHQPVSAVRHGDMLYNEAGLPR